MPMTPIPPTRPSQILAMIDALIAIEGDYSDDPRDAGGRTKFGITEAVARTAGYTGHMRDLKRKDAVEIYQYTYFIKPRFDEVEQLSEALAWEMFEIEVNLPPGRAAGFLQTALNGLNDTLGVNHYPDVKVDGLLGPATFHALTAYLKHRKALPSAAHPSNTGSDAIEVLLRLINSQQACYYLERTHLRPANERFLYGWVLQRISL